MEPWRQQVQRLRRRASLVNAASTLLWLDRQTTAACLGIGRSKLDERASLGVLKPCKLGQRTIFNRQHLDAYLNRLAGLTPPLGPGEKT